MLQFGFERFELRPRLMGVEHLKIRMKEARNEKVDFFGLGLVAVGVGFLEFTLDKGQEKDWFGSSMIVTCFGVWITSIGKIASIIAGMPCGRHIVFWLVTGSPRWSASASRLSSA